MNIDRVEPKNISRRKAVLVGSSAIAATCAISKADNHKAKKSEIVRGAKNEQLFTGEGGIRYFIGDSCRS